MNIRIIIEPDYKNSFWCTETVNGLSNQAYLRKIRVTEMKEDALERLTESKSGEVVAVIGTSISWINHIVSILQEKKLLFLLITGDQDARFIKRTNSILLDYHDSMQTLLACLRGTSGDKIALFGVNPSSYADSVKKDAFPWKDNIYYNFGSILTSTQQLWSNIDRFSAVICVNDIVAVYLLHYLEERGIRVPEQVRLLCFGGSILSRLMQSSITSVEQDFRVLGSQAVKVCAFIEKNPQLAVNVFIKCPLRVWESAQSEYFPASDSMQESADSQHCPASGWTPETLDSQHCPASGWAPETPDSQHCLESGWTPETADSQHCPASEKGRTQSPHVNFYIDESIAELQALDNLLSKADELDIQILRLLMQKMTQERIAEQLNLALSSLRYRIRKMSAHFAEPSKKNMLETIRLYLSDEALNKALRASTNQENGD